MDKKIWTFTVTNEELAIINEALIELPFKKAIGVINSLHNQFVEQSNKPKENQDTDE